MGNACVGGQRLRISTPSNSPTHAGATTPPSSTHSSGSSAAAEAFPGLPRRQASPDPTPGTRLRWPNGQLSAGQLFKAEARDWRFALSPSDSLVTARKAADGASQLLPLKVRPDPSAPRDARQSVPALPRLRDMHLDAAATLTSEDVEAILTNVSHRKGQSTEVGAGLSRHQQQGLLDLYASALDALARQVPSSPGIAAAARALANPIDIELNIGYDNATGGLCIHGTAGRQAEEVGEAIRSLRPGEHVFFPVNYNVLGGGSHAVGLSVTRLEDSARPTLRVSLTDTEYSEPGIYIDASPRKVLNALPGLLDGSLGQGGHLPQDDVMDVLLREPLRDWLAQLDPTKEVSSAYFDGKVLEQPLQNGASCGSENPLAFLATVLPPSEYKLAKAACLDAVLQLAESTIDDGVSNRSRERIQDRITHALAGSTLG